MNEGSDHTLAWMRRLDAKLDRMLSILEDHTGRLQRVGGRLTSLAARFAVIETFDHELARLERRLDDHRPNRMAQFTEMRDASNITTKDFQFEKFTRE